MHTQERFNNHKAHTLDMIMVMPTSVMGVMKMGNIVPRAGNETTSLAFWASVLPYITKAPWCHRTYLPIQFLACRILQ